MPECAKAHSVLPFYFLHFFNESFQIAGWNKIRSGYNSNRPASISKISIHFENREKIPKFWVGPTSSNPGPMLLMVAATAVKFVIKSFPLKERAMTDTVNRNIKVAK